MSVDYGICSDSLKIMVVDGGSVTPVREEGDDAENDRMNTFVLDMEKSSPNSWIWSANVEAGNLLSSNSQGHTKFYFASILKGK